MKQPVAMPPVHSPLRWRGLLRGLGAAFGSAPIPELEAELADRFAADAVLLLDRGTSALRLAIELAGPADRAVVLPAYACYDIATAAAGAGRPVRFYDLDPRTLGPNWSALERELERGVGSVVVAHLYGHPVDLARAASLCSNAGAVLIEDAAQAEGGWWEGQRLGSVGELSVLSFGRGKGLTGLGGGALMGRGAFGDRVRERSGTVGRGGAGWAALLLGAAQWALARRRLYGIPSRLPFLGLGETIYHEPWPVGPPSRAPLAIVLDSLHQIEAENEFRRQTARRLIEALPPAWEVPEWPAAATPGFLRLPVLPPAEGPHPPTGGMGTPYPTPLPELPRLRGSSGLPTFSGARTLCNRLVTLPTHGVQRESDIERLLASIAKGN